MSGSTIKQTGPQAVSRSKAGNCEAPEPAAEVYSAIRLGYLRSDHSLPLVALPGPGWVDLIAWATTNREFIEERLWREGAILFRNFGLREAEEFERLAQGVSSELLDYSYRSTPRTRVSGKVYTSTEYPAHQSIPLHNENAYSRNWPMKLWFFSLQVAEDGGETPIADSRKVYKRIPDDIREFFVSKGLMYVRNYGTGLDLPWQEVFQTATRAVVEDYCRSVDMECEWIGDDQLRTRQRCQTVAQHPRTGDMVWFNQAHLFHVSRLPAEVRQGLLSVSAEEDLPRNVYFGDGSPIEPALLDEISRVYEEEAVTFPWREGDILLVDNMLTAHGRKPFRGRRKVVVAMAEAHGQTTREAD